MPNQNEILRDGDDGFMGVNMRLSPENLQKGLVASAKNIRFDNGIITLKITDADGNITEIQLPIGDFSF